MRYFVNIFKDSVIFFSIDDKLKIDIGEFGQYILLGVWGKKSLVFFVFQLFVMDYDVLSKGFIILLVIFNVVLLEDKDGLFY